MSRVSSAWNSLWKKLNPKPPTVVLPPAVVYPKDRVGITGGMSGPNAYALLNESGAGWLRMPLNWAQFDTTERRQQLRRWTQSFRAQCPGVKRCRRGSASSPARRNRNTWKSPRRGWRTGMSAMGYVCR